MLIGIGCNIASAPVVPLLGKDAGRSSTCLALHGPSSSSQYTSNNIDNNDNDSSSSGSSSDDVSPQPLPEAEVDVGGDATTTATAAVTTPVDNSNINDTGTYYTNLCNELALEITGALSYYLQTSSYPTIDSGTGAPSDSVDNVIRDFERHMDFSPQILRKEYKYTVATTTSTTTTSTATSAGGTSTAGSSGVDGDAAVGNNGESVVGSVKGAEVVPIGLNRDGTLLVELTATGERRALVAEYLW